MRRKFVLILSYSLWSVGFASIVTGIVLGDNAWIDGAMWCITGSTIMIGTF